MSSDVSATGPLHAVPAGAGAASEAGCSSSLRESLDAMNGDTYQQKVVITNPQGLHLRPAAAFSELANRFQCTVAVIKEGKPVNGKSPWDLMSLVALQGTELTVETSGPDARDALAALVTLLATFAAEDDSEPPVPPKG